jgi:hypothetical protein
MLLAKVGGGMIRGVAVTMPGVCEGIGVQTGNGCGGAPHVSQPVRISVIATRSATFFMKLLYTHAVFRVK